VLLAHSARTPTWPRNRRTDIEAGELVSRIWYRNLWPRNASDGGDGGCDGENEDGEDSEEEDAASRRWDCCGALEDVEACNMAVRSIRLPKKITTDVSLLRDLA
jgi:hypothetical protein